MTGPGCQQPHRRICKCTHTTTLRFQFAVSDLHLPPHTPLKCRHSATSHVPSRCALDVQFPHRHLPAIGHQATRHRARKSAQPPWQPPRVASRHEEGRQSALLWPPGGKGGARHWPAPPCRMFASSPAALLAFRRWRLSPSALLQPMSWHAHAALSHYDAALHP